MQQDRMIAAAKLFGERLKEARLAAGVTQIELSQRTKIPAGEISSIEGGDAHITLDTMVLLADAVGAEAWDLVRPPPGFRAR